VRE
jgi:hypothetical protein